MTAAGAPHPIQTGTALDGRTWLTVADKSELSVRHATSARELTIHGPAKILPCADGDEHVIVAEGRVVTVAGPGARPGSEVVIGTPFGVVRYGNAQLEVKVTKTKVEALAQSGEGWVEPAAGARRTGAERIDSKKKSTLTGKAVAEELVEACRKAAADAALRARQVLDPQGDAGPLSDRATAHVRARQGARSACATAKAAVARLPELEQRNRQEALIRRAETLWKAVPPVR